MKYSRILFAIVVAVVTGVGSSFATCTWGWEQDNCQDVACPSGCYANGQYGVSISICNGNHPCCNCYYRRVYCSLNGQATTNCPYSTSSPNGKAWETDRQETGGPCTTISGYNGTICVGTQDPGWPEN